jgi:hypothetical protein
VVPSYVVASSALAYLWPVREGTLNVTLEVDNLTDATVQDDYGVQRPGRSFWAKISVIQ